MVGEASAHNEATGRGLYAPPDALALVAQRSPAG